MNILSEWLKKMFAYEYAQIVPMAQPIYVFFGFT